MGRAVAAGRCEIPHALIAPAVVQRILRHRQQLHVVIAHIPDVQRQLVGHIPVVQHLTVLCPPPGAKMHLVDVHAPLGGVGVLPALPPLFIVPRVAADVVELAVGGGPRLLMEAVGVGFPNLPAVALGHHVLIAVELPGVFHRQLPRAILQPAHIPALPFVKVSAQRHAAGLRRPYTKHPAAVAGMCAVVFIGAVPHAAPQPITAHSRHLLTCYIMPSPRKTAIACPILSYATFYSISVPPSMQTAIVSKEGSCTCYTSGYR